MPIRAPDTVQEVRVTLGRKEYEQLKNFEETQRKNVWLDAIPNIGIAAIGGGVFLAGYAALNWVGLSIKDLIDNASTTAAHWIGNLPMFSEVGVQRIETIGARIKWIQSELQLLWDEAYKLGTEQPTNWEVRHRQIMGIVERLVAEQDALREELNSYTTGETKWYEEYPNRWGS